MLMNELVRYDIPPELIQLWKSRESTRLLPLQELAVKKHGLFDKGNLLIQAPTSSGKTFIGEMAAVQTALRRKQVVYLVPLKALAEEKYLDFKDKYEAYGIRVLISTRDHRESDHDLEEGNFSIAVVVYEKLAQVMVRRPERLTEIELIIADELELLSDPDRGGTVEVLLTRIVQSPCRLIGLSAVIGEAERLAKWMRADLVRHERRPVELRFGVLHGGSFRYRTYNEFAEGEETLVDGGGDSAWETLTKNVCKFAEAGETSLVFVKSKHEARRGAECFAQRMSGPAATRALEQLRELEATCSRETLTATLEVGIGFHSTDLTPEERRVVEEAFRSGEVRVLVSTSTLAVGLNLPARNVFITADKWCYDRRFGMPWKAPIMRSEYESMGGRAGRYGAGHEFGRSILVAATPFDQETLWRRYVEGEREAIEPRLARDPLENYVLRLVASRFCTSEDDLLKFLECTPSGQWVWQEMYTLDEITCRVRAAVNRAVDVGALARNEEDGLEATPFGQAIAAKGILLGTARELERWIAESETRVWTDLDLILAAALTPDGRMYNVALTAREYDSGEYVRLLKDAAGEDELSGEVPLTRLRNCTVTPFFEEVRAIKIALFLRDWIDHAPQRELEEQYHTMTGQMLSAAGQVSWLIDAAAAIAQAQHCTEGFVQRLRVLSERVQRGLRAEALPLARSGAPGISRSAVVALVSSCLHTAQAIAGASPAALARFITPDQAERLVSWARRQQDTTRSGPDVPLPPPSGPEPLLIVDDRRPGRITLAGRDVLLQDKQYQLVRLLARTPGECVPYETIYEELWGTVVVEDNQMHFQKRKLLARVREGAPGHDEIVKTVPKQGFMLDLPPETVRVHLRGGRSVVAEGVGHAQALLV
jgi:helicase